MAAKRASWAGRGLIVGAVVANLGLAAAGLAYADALDPESALVLAVMLLAGLLAHSMIRQRQLVRELARRRGEGRDALALALRDPLTGLLNRRAMTDIVDRQQALAEKRALLLCDLDGFKQINDTYGHRAGDAVLREFARRLSVLRHEGVSIEAIRLGGDEFVLLAAGSALDPAAIAGDVLRAGAEPYEFEGVQICCSTAVGVATSQGAAALEEMLGMADDAMYDAKRSGLPVRIAPAGAAGPHGHIGRRIFEQQLDLRSTERTLFAAAIGIDRIQEMRRALGYGLGSKLVRELTQRLGLLDDQLFFERLSSDVLGIAFFAPNRDAASAILERLRDGVEGPATLAGASVDLRLTIGMAGPEQPMHVRDLTEQAQAALEDAWRRGARLKSFEHGDQAAASENIGLMTDLREAIATDALEVHYQPKLRVSTGEIESVEALVRWDHPIIGPISPSRFVPIAEKTGDIREMTEWVLNRILADRESLAARGHCPLIYLNVSAELVSDEAFADSLIARLAPLHGAVGIEITETAVLSNPERALPNLNRLADAGVKIAIDDYGVGLSSLAYLKQLPATELKLDMMFITNLATSHRDPMIVRSTIELAHGLGLLVTAEGVDNMESYALLKVMGCDLLQGFAISEALPVATLGDYLDGHDSSGQVAIAEFAKLRFAQAA